MRIDEPGSPEARAFRSAATARMREMLRLDELVLWQAGAFDAIEQMPRAWTKFRRIARAADAESIRDILAELTYALAFRHLGHAVALEPAGSGPGPDFAAVKDGASLVVEVHRFRVGPKTPQAQARGADDLLQPYGRGHADVLRALSRITEKFRQVGEGDATIALWSDDDGVEEIEVDLAVRELREEERSGIRRFPAGLSWIVYGSSWVLRGQQFSCFPLRDAARPAWCDGIEDMTLATVLAHPGVHVSAGG